MVSHGPLVVTVGEKPPAMSVSWGDGFYVMFMADADLNDEEAGEMQCAHCLMQDGDEQLGRGLDLARVHGQVDWDVDAGEWFVPYDDPERVKPTRSDGACARPRRRRKA